MSSATVRRKPAARLPRPAARYWKGKAPKGAEAADSDSEDEQDEEQQELEDEGDVLIADVEKEDEEEDEGGLEIRAEVVKKGTRAINVTLKDVNISKEGRVIVAGKEESGRTEVEREEGSSFV